MASVPSMIPAYWERVNFSLKRKSAARPDSTMTPPLRIGKRTCCLFFRSNTGLWDWPHRWWHPKLTTEVLICFLTGNCSRLWGIIGSWQRKSRWETEMTKEEKRLFHRLCPSSDESAEWCRQVPTGQSFRVQKTAILDWGFRLFWCRNWDIG